MKLIIAGSRTFTDYQLLCQTLAPERHRITQVLTAAPAARISSAFAGRSSTISARAASRGLGALWEVRRRAPQSPDGAGRGRAGGVPRQ